MDLTQRPIVFLHIPKTAGQTIHKELVRAVGSEHVSPIRVHTQAKPGVSQTPAGFRLYSGHIDWDRLETLTNPFTFSVLRDPRERIASFYFFLLQRAESLPKAELEKPQNTGLRRVLYKSASDYFFAGEPSWRRFIHDHYDNFYCSYFATRKMRGWHLLDGLGQGARMQLALSNMKSIDRLYCTQSLAVLQKELGAGLGCRLNIVNSFVNVGRLPQGETRWPRLLALLDRDKDASRLEAFAQTDTALMAALDLSV